MAAEEHFDGTPTVGWLRKFLKKQGWCKQTLYEAERENAYLQCERGSNEIFRIYLEMADNSPAIVLWEFNHSENETNLWMYRLDSDHQEDLKELEQYIQRNYFDN